MTDPRNAPYQQGQVTFLVDFDQYNTTKQRKPVLAGEPHSPYAESQDAKIYKIEKGEGVVRIYDECWNDVVPPQSGQAFGVTALNGLFRGLSEHYKHSDEMLRCAIESRIGWLGIADNPYLLEADGAQGFLVSVAGADQVVCDDAIGVGDFVRWCALTPKEYKTRMNNPKVRAGSKATVVFRRHDPKSVAYKISVQLASFVRSPQHFAYGLNASLKSTSAKLNASRQLANFAINCGMITVHQLVKAGVLIPAMASDGDVDGRNAQREQFRNEMVSFYARPGTAYSGNGPHPDPYGLMIEDTTGNDHKDDVNTGIVAGMSYLLGTLPSRYNDASMARVPGSYTDSKNTTTLAISHKTRTAWARFREHLLLSLFPSPDMSNVEETVLCGYNRRTGKNIGIDASSNTVKATPVGAMIDAQINNVRSCISAFEEFHLDEARKVIGKCTKGGAHYDKIDIFGTPLL